MKKFIIMVIGLVTVAIIAASIYVSTIDWNKHKGALSAQLAEITGKKISFNGPVSMSVFPMPYITAKNVVVYSSTNQNPDKPLMKIDNLVARLSFSALLGGSFDVKMMSLVKPKVFIEYTENGLNWLDDAQTKDDVEMKDVHIALDSVLLSDATVQIVDEQHNINTTLENLKAEIVADSLHGPYRIDGSYMKDNSPQGFAISTGNLSDSFASNLNFVLSQPSSDTYIRFDGTFLLSNEALNGNLMIESKKFKEFYATMIPSAPLGDYWDDNLEASMELKVNQTQMELANIILKYGKTAGAGNIIVPLKSKSYVIGEDDDAKRDITLKFDMTEWDLEPFVALMKEYVREQMAEGAIYDPHIPFDMNVNLTALKAEYNDQIIKDFNLKMSLLDNVWNVTELSGQFPGNTQVSGVGKIFSVEDVLSYTATVEAEAENLKKVLDWLEIPVTTVANSTYQKSTLNASIVGDMRAIQVSPFTLSVDNTVLNGHFGAKRGQPNHYGLEITTDNIILDNYLPRVLVGHEEDALQIISDLWAATGWANDVDVDFKLTAGLLIYEKISFEKLQLSASLQKGILNIQNLNIEDVLKANVAVNGEIGGFGDKLKLSNLNYKITVADFAPWMEKFKIENPDINLNFFQPFTSEGVVSMNTGRIWIKADNRNGNVVSSYNGRVSEADATYNLEGDLQLRAPQISDLLKNLKTKYIPQDDKLGRLALKAHILGSLDNFKLSDMVMSIGSNIFQGTIGIDKMRSVPYMAANLKINRFEADRFLPKNENNGVLFEKEQTAQNVTFWSKPYLSDKPFNLSQFDKLQFASDLEINELLFKNKLFKNVKTKFENRNGALSLIGFKAGYNDGDVMANLKLNLSDAPRLSGDVSITNQKIYDMGLVGSVYGLKSGVVEVNASLDSSAHSPRDIIDHFTGTVNLNINNPVVVGWDFDPIADDLQLRKISDGLVSVLNENLRKGETTFNKFSGKISFKDGEWAIDRASFLSDDAYVDISGQGALAPWQMNSTFSVQLTDIKTLPPFAFVLKGDMARPELEVDPSQITKVYDEQQAAVAAEKKRKQEEYERDLRDQVESQRVLLEEVKGLFKEFVENTYRPLSSKFSDEKYKEALSKIEDKLKGQERQFAEADSILSQTDIKPQYPEQLAQINKQAKELIGAVDEEIHALYMQNLKDQISRHYQSIDKLVAEKTQLMQDSLAEKGQQLAKLDDIQTSYKFQYDSQYETLANAIAEQMKAFDNIVQNADVYYIDVATEDDVTVLEKYVVESSEMLVKAQKQSEQLKEKVNEYLKYMRDKVAREDEAYKKRLQSDAALKAQKEASSVSLPQNKKTIILVPSSVDEGGDGQVVEIQPQAVPVTEDEVLSEDWEVNLFNPNESAGTASGVVRRK